MLNIPAIKIAFQHSCHVLLLRQRSVHGNGYSQLLLHPGFRRVRENAESDCQFRDAGPSVRPHGTVRLPSDRLS